jgi:hypothetical protein
LTKPPGDVTIETIIAEHRFALIGDMAVMAAGQSKASKVFSCRTSLEAVEDNIILPSNKIKIIIQEKL